MQKEFASRGEAGLAQEYAAAVQRHAHLMAVQPKTPDGSVCGLTASPGKVTATARVVTKFAIERPLLANEILVTTMTDPNYNGVVSRAAAIITDEGGILCHAAILARELHIPCLVGTHNATSLIHSGTTVTVDADSGVARIEKFRKP